jgi:Fe-S-cluster containining protein
MDYSEIEKIFYSDGYRIAENHLHDGITGDKVKHAIGELYRSLDDLLDSFISRTGTEERQVVCSKGCHWCCHQAVFAVTHEWLYIREYIASSLPEGISDVFSERAKTKSKRTLALPAKELLKFKDPCPFLDDGACSVYPARPMACRIYLSSSVQSCREEFLNPHNKKNIPQLFEFPLRSGRMMNEGFVAYLREKGLPVAELPLEQGYSSMETLGQDMDGWIRARK